MASSAEQTFYAAVAVAEGVRQQAKSVAFIAYGYNPANLTTYRTALSDADVAYITAVNTALNASDLPLGNLGQGGPLPFSNWAPFTAIA